MALVSGCSSDRAALSPDPFGAGTGGAADSAAGDGGGGGSLISSTVIPSGSQNCDAESGPAIPALQWTPIASGLQSPIALTQAPGDSSRLFIVEKPGVVRLLVNGQLTQEPFLDIREPVSERAEEMGLLGFTFHPDYAESGRVYVYYSTNASGGDALADHTSQLVEYTVSRDNPDRVDPASARLVLSFSQPQANHNGGDLHFGADGFLYISTGDGGGANDEHGSTGNGQNLSTLLGKMLRIDVEGRGASGEQYLAPPGNLGGAALPEIWSYGLRNPWRFSFDACTGDMYIADVGQDNFEEVNFEPRGLSGRNYGWRLMEAERCFNPASGCDAAAQGITLPVANYGRGLGQSITGGYVYRGSAIPSLRGTYVYADYLSANFFALRIEAGTVAMSQQNISSSVNADGRVERITAFGQDQAGEVYVLSLSGEVYRLDPG